MTSRRSTRFGLRGFRTGAPHSWLGRSSDWGTWKGWLEIGPVDRSILEAGISENSRGTLESVPDRAVSLPPNVQKIRIINANTLFRMLIPGNPEAGRQPIVPEDAGDHPALTEAEDYALKLLTAEYMEALPRVERAKVNVQPGTTEIDVLGLSARKPVNAEQMTLCSCKQLPAKHDPVCEEKRMWEFLGEIASRERWERSGTVIVKALVSPDFGDADRKRLAVRGFKLIDFRTMARKLGFDPGPRADPVSTVRRTPLLP